MEELKESFTRIVIELLEELPEPQKTDLWNGIDELVERKVIYDYCFPKDKPLKTTAKDTARQTSKKPKK